jgi:tRNA modification GTPase
LGLPILKREIILSHDLICACSSPAGYGARQIIRITGDKALDRVSSFFHFKIPGLNISKGLVPAIFLLDDFRSVEIVFYFWKSPASYTGQDVIELHLISNSWIVDLVFSKLFECGFRPAKPGEFTLRAFLNGKIDIAQVDAIHQVIEASTPDGLYKALGKLAGGVFDPLHKVKDDLLNLLADVEANLDFSTEDILIISSDAILKTIGDMLAQIIVLVKKLQSRGIGDEKVRVIIVGPPNAGKSSLFNILVSGQKSLVSPIPGTTRDLVTSRIDWDDSFFELVDAPGIEDGRDFIEQQAQKLAVKDIGLADVIVYCADKNHQQVLGLFLKADEKSLLKVATKIDVSNAPDDWIHTSSITSQGIELLKKNIIELVHQKNGSASASGLARINGYANLCLDNLRRAHHCVLFEEPLEILALELREAIENLGQITGHVFTDDLLDRMFSRFCVGK